MAAHDAKPDMSAPSRLLALAPELLVEIAEHLDNTSLLNFRQAHSELEANSFAVFGSRFFGKRTHVATKSSLDVLRSITASPTLVKYVGHIEILMIGVNIEYERALDIPGAYPYDLSKFNPWRKEVDDAYGIESSGVLDDIFANLKEAGTGRIVQINGIDYYINPNEIEPNILAILPEAHGLAAYIRSVQQWAHTSQLTGDDTGQVAEAALRALARSHHEIGHLAIDTRKVKSAVSYSHMSSREVDGLKLLGYGMESLQMTLNFDTTLSPSCATILSAAAHLKALTLCDVDTRILRDIARNLNPAAPVEHLSVWWISDQDVTLISFIRRFQKSLRSLEVEGYDGQECIDFMQDLRQNTCMDQLYLKDLTQWDDVSGNEFDFGDSAGTGPWEAKGEQAVAELLKHLVDQAKLWEQQEE